MYKTTIIHTKGSYLDRYREALEELAPLKMFIEVRTADGITFAVGGDTHKDIAEGVASLVKAGNIIDEDELDRDLPQVKQYLKFNYRRRGWLVVRTITEIK